MSTEQQQVSVSVDVAASPDVVWGLVSDLARMGDWSPECTGVRWAGAAPGPTGPTGVKSPISTEAGDIGHR